MPGDPDQSRADPSAARTLRAAAGFVLFGLVALSPWPFGCVTPRWNLALAAGLLVVLGLWAAHAVVTRRFAYRSDPVSVCLLGLVLVTAAQLVPLPGPVVRALSPAAAELHRAQLPESPELLPGESEADAPTTPAWGRLSLAPAATEDLLVQFLAAFLAYAAARNFVASRETFRQLVWVGFATGVLLAVLGLSQYLSGERNRIYWQVEIFGTAFGPFPNKNHFAFQVLLFVGLGIGLYLRLVRRAGPRSPAAVGVLAGLGLMLAAVGFSQSRGGAVAAALAGALTLAVGWRAGGRGADRRALLGLAAGVAAVAVGLTAWLGWHGVVDRLATLAGSEADNRSADWGVGLRLARKFPLAGVGGGALPAAEPLVRTRPDQGYVFNTMDNDYLEALVEGGVLRLALTLGLAAVAVGTAVVAARRQADHRDGPLLLGCVFGLAAVAFQSAVDFGLHVPSVALAAAVTAAFVSRSQETGDRRQETDRGVVPGSAAVSAARDASQRPRRPRSRQDAGGDRRQETGDGRQETENGLAATRSGASLTGGAAYGAAGFVVFAGLLVVLADWRVFRVDGLRSAARAVARGGAVWRDEAIRYLDAAVKIRPNDAAAWADLAAVHLDAAADRQTASLAAVAGPSAFVLPPREPPAGDPGGHVAAALNAARQARNRQPVLALPHLQLGTFAGRFARSEPAAVHFDRAKRVAGFDPDVWFTGGNAAAARGDWPDAFADWRESLARSPRRLPGIARAAAGRVPPDQFRTAALPDDPAVWLAATPFLFPDPADPGRADWFRAIAARGSAGPEPNAPAGFLAWAAALKELGDAAGELRVLRRATDRFPDDVPTRDQLAARLEAAESYEEAVPVLEWLTARRPDDRGFRDRLEAARHALKLKADIEGP